MPSQEVLDFIDNWRFGPEHCLGTPSFALHEPPDYKSARHDPDINRCFYTIVGYENAEEVSEYILDAMENRPPELPAAGIWVNTLWDPSQAPPGKHAMNGWYFFPRASDLTPAEWEEMKQTYNARFLALWEKYAPNMTRDNVIADALYTPYDIEQEMGMREGDFGHGRQKDEHPGPGRGRGRGPSAGPGPGPRGSTCARGTASAPDPATRPSRRSRRTTTSPRSGNETTASTETAERGWHARYLHDRVVRRAEGSAEPQPGHGEERSEGTAEGARQCCSATAAPPT